MLGRLMLRRTHGSRGFRGLVTAALVCGVLAGSMVMAPPPAQALVNGVSWSATSQSSIRVTWTSNISTYRYVAVSIWAGGLRKGPFTVAASQKYVDFTGLSKGVSYAIYTWECKTSWKPLNLNTTQGSCYNGRKGPTAVIRDPATVINLSGRMTANGSIDVSWTKYPSAGDMTSLTMVRGPSTPSDVTISGTCSLAISTCNGMFVNRPTIGPPINQVPYPPGTPIEVCLLPQPKNAAVCTSFTITGPPDPPVSPTLSAGSGYLDASWTAPADNGFSIWSYSVVVTGDDGSTKSCPVTAGTTNCRATGLKHTVNYTFAVTATNAAGSSQAATVTGQPGPPPAPSAPINVTATPGNEEVLIEWDPNILSDSVESYTVTASPGGSTCTTALTSCTVTGLTNGTTYTFSVTAYNGSTSSATTVTERPITPAKPDPPTNLTVRANVGGGGALNGIAEWDQPANTGTSALSRYTVTAKTLSGTEAGTCSTNGILKTCTVPGLERATEYVFTVVATNAVGDSLPSEPATATTQDVPGTPTLVGVGDDASAPGMIEVVYGAPSSDGGSPITGYRATVKPGGNICQGGPIAAPAPYGSCIVSGLTPGQTYTVSVQAINLVGFSSAATTSHDAVLRPNTISLGTSPASAVPSGSVQLVATGAQGSGAITYSAAPEAVCQVSVSGVVSTVDDTAATCSVDATVAASGEYDAKTSEPWVIRFEPEVNPVTISGNSTARPDDTVQLTGTPAHTAGAVTFALAPTWDEYKALLASLGLSDDTIAAAPDPGLPTSDSGCAVTSNGVVSTTASGDSVCIVIATVGAAGDYRETPSSLYRVAFQALNNPVTVTGNTSASLTETVQLSATPENPAGAVTFADTGVGTANCTVTSSGAVTVDATDGTCIVTATVEAGGNFLRTTSAPFTITFARLPNSVTISGTTPAPSNSTVLLTAAVQSGDDSILWADGGTGTCTVDSGGTVTATGLGDCVITATVAESDTHDGAVGTFTIAFTAAANSISLDTSPSTSLPDDTVQLVPTDYAGTGLRTYALVEDGTGGNCTVGQSSGLVDAGGSEGTCDVEVSIAPQGLYGAATSPRWTVRFTTAPAADPSPAPGTPPTAPVDVTATAGDTSATVSWSKPLSSGSYPITDYEVRSIPESMQCLTADLSCDITGLTNGVSYTFEVRALNGAGWGPWSQPSVPVTPSAAAVPEVSATLTRDLKQLRVVGTVTNAAPGDLVTPMVKLTGQDTFRPGFPVALDANGAFTWTRKVATNKSARVYFTVGTGTSPTLGAARPSVVISGTRKGTSITITGTTRNIASGSPVHPWIKFNGGRAIKGATLTVGNDGTFTWTYTTAIGDIVRVKFNVRGINSVPIVL